MHTIQLLDYPGSEPSDAREQEEGHRGNKLIQCEAGLLSNPGAISFHRYAFVDLTV